MLYQVHGTNEDLQETKKDSYEELYCHLISIEELLDNQAQFLA